MKDIKAKERWVDVGKCVAIFAVMTDHLRGVLYSAEGIQRASYFSVTLFVLLMGLTTYWSFDNSTDFIWKKVSRRVLSIIVPYVVAVFVYHCISVKGFYWTEYWKSLILFNASGPHYYVLLYIQLVVVSPLLFHLIKLTERLSGKKSMVIEFAFGGGIAYVGRITTIHSNISDIYAGRLFGGSYILCLYIGMLIGKHYSRERGEKRKVLIGFVVAFISMVIMLYLLYGKGFVFDNSALLGSIINPHGITLLLCAVTVMMSICFWDKLATDIAIFNALEELASYIGKHTLYIFLYHCLFLDFLRNRFFITSNNYIRIPLYYFTMLFGSIMVERVLVICKKWVVQSYMYRKENDENEKDDELCK